MFYWGKNFQIFIINTYALKHIVNVLEEFRNFEINILKLK